MSRGCKVSSAVWLCVVTAAPAINQRSVCLPLSCRNVLGVVGGNREGRQLLCAFPGFSVSDGTELVMNWARFRVGEEGRQSLVFRKSSEIYAWESPLFPKKMPIWHKFAMLTKKPNNLVCFYPNRSKSGFIDKLVIIAQLVRKLFGLISHLFMTVV